MKKALSFVAVFALGVIAGLAILNCVSFKKSYTIKVRVPEIYHEENVYEEAIKELNDLEDYIYENYIEETVLR